MFSGIIYKTLHFLWTPQVVTKIILALIASTIFYFIVVYFPRKKANKIAMEFMIETYKRTRIGIIKTLLTYLNKRQYYKDLEENYLDYVFIRNLVNDNDMNYLINYNDPEKFRKLNIEILYELDKLKNTLMYTLPYDFIKQNNNAYKRFNYLAQWVEQFHHTFNTTYRPDDDLEYKNDFRIYVDEHIRGISNITGEEQTDDFIKIIEDSFKSSLFLHQMRIKLFR